MKEQFCYDYPRPAVTADTIIFSKESGRLEVLLIERKYDPFGGRWALPGGFIQMDETTRECAERELNEETGIKGVQLKQLHTFSAINRDPRGRTISVVYYGFINKSDVSISAGDDAAMVRWFNINDVPQLAFDHDLVIKVALEKIQSA